MGNQKLFFFVRLSLTLFQVLRTLSHLKGSLGYRIGVLLAEILEINILGLRLACLSTEFAINVPFA